MCIYCIVCKLFFHSMLWWCIPNIPEQCGHLTLNRIMKLAPIPTPLFSLEPTISHLLPSSHPLSIHTYSIAMAARCIPSYFCISPISSPSLPSSPSSSYHILLPNRSQPTGLVLLLSISQPSPWPVWPFSPFTSSSPLISLLHSSPIFLFSSSVLLSLRFSRRRSS